jgi:hypothetical protein
MSENMKSPEEAKTVHKNPLASWFRQPKIYVKLPSKGKFYTAQALDRSSNEEYAVYAMTAKDELMFKTPDALVSGQSTVEVIQSCVPAIKNAWEMPAIDLDFLLMAIRIATYGDMMEVGSNCPHCEAENSYELNLNDFIGRYSNFDYADTINVEPLTVHIRPYNYKEMTKIGVRGMEEQKIFSIVNDDSIPDEEKLERFGKSFVRITELTVDIIANCITKIETPNGPSTDKVQIKEFINNCPKELFEKISDHVTKMKEQVELKPQQVKCSECEKEYEMPITMDQSNFFAVRS